VRPYRHASIFWRMASMTNGSSPQAPRLITSTVGGSWPWPPPGNLDVAVNRIGADRCRIDEYLLHTLLTNSCAL